MNNHPPSNLATDLTPIQNLFNKDENKPTILNHIEPLLANNAALNAIEEITQKLPFITDIQQKKVALTFIMVPLLSAINKSVSNKHFTDIQSIQTAVVALTDVRTPQEFNNWKTNDAPAILTLHKMLNENPELKAATMECLNRAANHPRPLGTCPLL